MTHGQWDQSTYAQGSQTAAPPWNQQLLPQQAWSAPVLSRQPTSIALAVGAGLISAATWSVFMVLLLMSIAMTSGAWGGINSEVVEIQVLVMLLSLVLALSSAVTALRAWSGAGAAPLLVAQAANVVAVILLAIAFHPVLVVLLVLPALSTATLESGARQFTRTISGRTL